MIALEKTLSISGTSVHFNIPFTLEEDARKLEVLFSYSPKNIENMPKSRAFLRESLKIYTPGKEYSDKELEEFLPLKNFLTISLDSPSGWVGTAHRHPPSQHHIISAEGSSRGFLAVKPARGVWNITVSSFYVMEGSVEARIEVRYE